MIVFPFGFPIKLCVFSRILRYDSFNFKLLHGRVSFVMYTTLSVWLRVPLVIMTALQQRPNACNLALRAALVVVTMSRDVISEAGK